MDANDKAIVNSYIDWLISKALLEMEREGKINPSDDEVCKYINKHMSSWER